MGIATFALTSQAQADMQKPWPAEAGGSRAEVDRKQHSSDSSQCHTFFETAQLYS